VSSRITVSRSLITAMQAVSDAVAVHPWYVHADLPRDKLRRVLSKLRERYPDLERDRWHASRRREKGEASHVLVVYWPEPTHTGWFVLMSSKADDSGEKWQDTRERGSRLRIRAGWWELVRHTPAKLHPEQVEKLGKKLWERTGRENLRWSSSSGKPRWTWRMSDERYSELESEIKQASGRGKVPWLMEFPEKSKRWPGFAGIRTQHKKLGNLLFRQWLKNQRGDPPVWPRLPYATRRAKSKTAAEIELPP